MGTLILFATFPPGNSGCPQPEPVLVFDASSRCLLDRSSRIVPVRHGCRLRRPQRDELPSVRILRCLYIVPDSKPLVQVAWTELQTEQAQPTADRCAGSDAAQGLGRQGRDPAVLHPRVVPAHRATPHGPGHGELHLHTFSRP